jgi:ataxia telangiectasia mutated family protein
MIRIVLHMTLGNDTPTTSHQPTDRDDKDGFGPIRTATAQQSSDMWENDVHSRHHISEVCIAFLTVGPALQSTSGEPTRDKELTETILDCAENTPQAFFLAFPIYLEKARQGILSISVKNFDRFLNELAKLLQLYAYARSRSLQALAIQFLNSTLDIWASRQVAIGEVLDKVRDLCAWLSGALHRRKIRSWMVRDLLARFLNIYLLKDPHQWAWESHGDNESEGQDDLSPIGLLPFMNSDEDVRVRFRAAVINARLFAVARIRQSSAMEMYKTIKRHYTVDIDKCVNLLHAQQCFCVTNKSIVMNTC